MKHNGFKTKICKALASVGLVLGVASCSYLDVAPLETVDKDDMLQTHTDALEYLYGCYGAIQNDEMVKAFSRNHSHWGSDEVVALAPQNNRFQLYQWNRPNGSDTNGWQFTSYYDAIGYCNQFIEDLAAVYIDDLDDAARAQYVAEAKFIKAYFHYLAMQYYGPVPIMDKMLAMDTPKEDFPGRQHIDYCAQYVANLCDEAYADLPTSYGPQSFGRATKAVAKFLKAKVLWLVASPIFNGEFYCANWRNENYETPGYGKELVSYTYDPEKWEKALTATQEALDEALSAGHKLLDLDVSEVRRAADAIPLPQIPGVDTSTPEGEEFAKRVMLMRYVPVLGPEQGSTEQIWGMLYLGGDLDNIAIPHFVLYDQNGVRRGKWGWLSPTLYTVQNFLTKDGKLPKEDPNFPAESDWYKSAGLLNPDIINLYVNREPRFYANIGFDGDEYSPVIAADKPLILNMKDSKTNGYNPDYGANDQSATGFLNKKWVHPNARFTGINDNNNLGICWDHTFGIFRMADLYLMKAECCGRLNKYLEDGVEALNTVRKRAGVPELELEDVSGNGELLKATREEIFAEYYFETRRQLEIRRNLEGKERMSKHCYQGLNALVYDPTFEEFNQVTQIDQSFDWNDRMYLYPIPNSELYSNPQLVQAPYY